MPSPTSSVRRARDVGSAALAALVVAGGALLGVDALGSSYDDGTSASVRVPSRPGDPPVVGDHAGTPGEAGSVLDGPAVFDSASPAVANLDPDLLGALRRAATDAGGDGVALRINSGWRSAEHQAQLLRDAVSEYGSEREAARWVATPETSAHVSGDAVDVGPADGARWLSRHGSAYGLCQIYANEPWHYELRPDAVDEGCPAMYADPTDDPRMRQ